MSERSRDDSFGFYNATTGTFTVPENGRYEMTLNLVSYSKNFINEYYVVMNLDGKMIDQIRERTRNNGKLTTTRNNGTQPASLGIMISEVDAKKGQVFSFTVTYQYSETLLSRGGCYMGDKELGCSFLQGKLTKRY